ncbi:MAG: hypothetical protein RLZZ15_956 [Verrucomicrobiota bacterium]|jgi:tetratricopeptide (TPR) repeat protein
MTSRRRLLFGCAFVGVALHAIALVVLWRGGPLAGALLAHAVGSVAWGWGTAGFLPDAQARAWWLPAAVALLAPGAGLLASLAFVSGLRRPPPDRSAEHYVVWADQVVADATAALPSGASGQSIVEILQSPRTELRRNAVLALRDLDPQLAIQLLRKGLQDSDEQVRIYAQNILSGMMERFEGTLKELEQRLAAEPGAALHAVRVAEQYHEFVYLDVAGDDQTAAHYLGKALGLLRRAADLAPTDAGIALLGLKCALRARDLTGAREWFARLSALAPDVRQVLPWEMELAFLAGDWAALRATFARFERSGAVNPRIEALVQFWNGAPAPAA